VNEHLHHTDTTDPLVEDVESLEGAVGEPNENVVAARESDEAR
jgi:hypothetical protein